MSISSKTYKKAKRTNLNMKNETRIKQLLTEWVGLYYSFIWDKSPRKYFERRFVKNYFREDQHRFGLDYINKNRLGEIIGGFICD